LAGIPVFTFAHSIAGMTFFAGSASGLSLVFAAIFVVIVLNGIFTSGEVAVDLLRTMHIRAMEGEPRKMAVLQDLHDGRRLYVAAANMGSNTMRAWMFLLCFVPARPLSDWFESQGWMKDGIGSLLLAAIVISIPVAAVNVIVGELIPRTYAAENPSATCFKLAGFLRLFRSIFIVPARLSLSIATLGTKRFGATADFSIANQKEEEIKTLIESAGEEGAIEEQEVEMLDSVFEFGDTVAREVMTPRIDLDSVPAAASLIEVARLVVETGHSRIPVFEGTDDQILGVVHAKDILQAMSDGRQDASLSELMRPAVFVPENKGLHDLLKEMRSTKTQLVVVQDEYGGTSGIVTIEDIVEEVMGEIVDEYDREEPAIVASGNGFIVDGRLHLDDVNDEIGSSLDSPEFDTIGGYVFGLFGRQPDPGEVFEENDYRFTVTETDGRRITKLRLERIERPGDFIDVVAEALR
jgi:putative hemolysin